LSYREELTIQETKEQEKKYTQAPMIFFNERNMEGQQRRGDEHHGCDSETVMDIEVGQCAVCETLKVVSSSPVC
jgi:hypothetical protein